MYIHRMILLARNLTSLGLESFWNALKMVV